MGHLATDGWPQGSVAFLFTDIEGSTGLWERFPEQMSAAYARHDAILRAAIEAHGGVVFKVIGDAVHAAFPDPAGGLAAALEAQRGLATEPWPLPRPLRVRMALHVCRAAPGPDHDYRTPDLDRLDQLLAAGHGGQLLLSAAVAATVRSGLPTGVALRDLGERRLKDLPGTERIFQVDAAGRPAEFPPLATLDARPYDLPAPPSPLIGREHEVETIRDLLRDGGARLVTLTGTGGVGKTRLALGAAAGLVDAFANGVRWVPLGTVADPALVVPTVARGLGVVETPGRPLAETLGDWLRPRTLLLVLDNCEQVRDAVTDTVAGWLGEAPGVRVLATSRGRLRLGAERILAIGPLPVPALSASELWEVDRAPAGALFLDRVRAAGAIPVDADAPGITRICALLEGLPLALELAAARADQFTSAELADRLADRLGELVDGPLDLPTRQQTLRAAISWSYDLLNGVDQAVFRRVSVFAGGFVEDAASEVCVLADGDLPDALVRLVDESLIRREVEGETVRYFQLETVREFGRECLVTAGEALDAERRHGEYVLSFATESDTRLREGRQRRWLDRIERELPNIRVALSWAFDADRVADALHIAGKLEWFWFDRGYWTEGRGWLERALAACAENERSPAICDALRAIALIEQALVELPSSKRHLDRAIVVAEATGDPQRAAEARLNLSVVLAELGDRTGAYAAIHSAVEGFTSTGDESRWNVAKLTLAQHELNFGQAEDALRILTDLQLRQIPDPTLFYAVLAVACRVRGDFDRAQTAAVEALTSAETHGLTENARVMLVELVWISLDRGNPGAAARWLQRGLTLDNAMEDPFALAELLIGAGRLALTLGNGLTATSLLGGADSLLEDLGLSLLPNEEAYREQLRAATRADLGQGRFAVEHAAGRALAVDKVVAFAMETASDALRGFNPLAE